MKSQRMAGFVITLIPLGGWLGLVVKGLLFVGVYLVLISLIGLNGEEKALVNTVLKKLKIK